MDKNIIKIIGLIVGLIALVGGLVYLLIAGVEVGPLNAVSVSGIAEKGEAVETAKLDLEKAQTSYDSTLNTLEKTKKEFNTEKEAYELISDEKIKAVKEATKEEEYMIEYLWITLGNYATKHNLGVAIVEPGGTTGGAPSGTAQGTTLDVTDVSTGTGVSGNASGVQSTPPSTSANQTGENGAEQTQPTTSVTTGLTSSADALTVQIKGSYMDLADFVFEVENDKSLRFRLDNIKMSSAGGTEVITSFNVKDFTVLKSLQRETPTTTDKPESLLGVE